jgi:hypothetical protein
MNREEVNLFQQQPSAWAEDLDHPANCQLRFRKMVEKPATVYEVKVIHGRTIDCDVVSYGLKISQLYTFEQLDVDVGGNKSAGGPDLLTQPCCHRTAPPAPTSRHRDPGGILRAVIRRFVMGSRCCSSRESLRLALSQELSSA